ncbi:hypothetical protein SAMN04487820_108286 [Actinopolyspora mzabensis]|uniref:Uncharacterized protein n=1 Tax=Actinopolyspora mzabensis TaxID=995066 RepID=A0A1G9CF79_ACTMZ|nr:hypothetical protein SAMN04487820_108286 [Actinopolyspora mzabensis]
MEEQHWEAKYDSTEQLFSGNVNGVLVNETRPRTAPQPEGTPHTHDTVLRARRLR